MSNSNALVLRENLTALREQLVPMIQREMKRNRLTGLSLALVDGAKVAWAEGFGYADKEQGIPATPETVYKICSISKLFTATAAMQLVEQGRLDLDQPVQSYIPEFSIQTRYPQSKPITVRSLMTHHSGLPVDNRRAMYAADADHDPEPFQTALDYLHHTYVAYPVDYIFSYSNVAIDALGILIERVNGETFEAYITRHVLKPLGMGASSMRLNETARKRLSKGYHLGKGVWEPMSRDIPAGGIHSTVLDMARFIGMVNGQGTFEGGSTLRAETLVQMLTPQNAGNPLDFNLAIGLNWVLSRPALEYAGQVCCHDGSSQHFNTQLVVLPEQQLGVVVLCNSDTGAAATAAIADEVLKLALKMVKGIEPPALIRAPTQAGQTKLDEYAGDYPTASMGLVSLKPTSRTATLNLKGLPLTLVLQQDGWYKLRLNLFGWLPVPMKQLDNIRVSFQTIQGESVMAFEQGGLQIAVARRYQRQPISAAWQTHSGKYRNVDTSDITIKTLELVCANGWLWIEAIAYKLGRIKIYLQPVSDDQALTLGLGRMANETVFVKDGRLELWGMVFERL